MIARRTSNKNSSKAKSIREPSKRDSDSQELDLRDEIREAPQRVKVKRKPKENDGKKPPRIKLSDHGVTFERYKAELERGILYGYKPHFCYPVMRFNDI